MKKKFHVFWWSFCVGILMDLPVLCPPLLDCLEAIHPADVIWGWCNAPAFFFALFCGPFLYSFVLPVAIPLQWILIISLIIVAGRALLGRISRCMQFASEMDDESD